MWCDVCAWVSSHRPPMRCGHVDHSVVRGSIIKHESCQQKPGPRGVTAIPRWIMRQRCFHRRGAVSATVLVSMLDHRRSATAEALSNGSP